jgi:nicotinate-nucleotide adenylyltransferase
MILVYGGAFNPPTKAHKTIFETLLSRYQPSLFVFIPVGSSYPKSNLVDFEHRKAMLELMTQHSNSVLISDIEQQSAFKGTVKALDYFKQTYQEPVKFVLGLDNLLDLPNWIEYGRLLSENEFIAIDRNGSALEAIRTHYPNHKNHFDVIELDIKSSSTAFRNDPIKNQDMIDDAILAYIFKHHLYGV